ncbi:MAG: hypothetical protein NC314_01475 [Roseburia sp.]|nr:hypothetical protein [Roseburia sp.]MCM1241485.1 hypothetical protein [Roseburia sp.]
MEQVAFNEFYLLMNIAGIIIIEDTIEFALSRTAVVYDYLMLTDDDKENLVTNISKEQMKDKLCKINKVYSECKNKFIWDEIPKRDVEYYVEKQEFNELKSAIENITEEELEENKELFQRFGLGVKSEKAIGYRGLLEGAKQEGISLPIRVYTNFLASDLKCIEEDLIVLTRNDKFCLCVIDNFMKGEARGKEIINELQKNSQARKSGICIALSSQQENIARNTDDMYVGFVNKSAEDVDNEIKKHLIMSQYKIILALLNEKRINALQKSFLYAASNMNVAVYLSSMAKEEGITNHEILDEWIDLREHYYTYQEGRKEIKRTILLSSLFEKIGNGEVTKKIEDTDLVEFQRFEQYDYHVNEFMSPPMTGDIFYIKGKYYLLVGQECDLSVREGERNNSIAELIPVNLVKNKDMGNCKENYNFEKLLLGKFLTIDGQCCNISIDCTKREVIDNEILDLCAFNDCGVSEICLKKNLKAEAKYLLPSEWQQYYEDLKLRLSNLKNKYSLIEEHEKTLGFNVGQLVKDMGASHNNRLISIIDFVSEDNVVKYDAKRICRIRNHVLLINKMYLEYRGRQAFNTINMDVGRTSLYTIEMVGSEDRVVGKSAIVILTTSRKENCNVKRRDWVVKKTDILQFIKDIKPDEIEKYEEMLNDLDEKLLLEDISGVIGKNVIKYIKQSKDDELLLKIQLLK